MLQQNDPDAWQVVLKWVEGFPGLFRPGTPVGGLVLFGKIGTGKSRLAATLLNHVNAGIQRFDGRKRSYSAAWLLDDELDRMLRDYRHKNFRTDEEDEIMFRLREKTQLVAVDDALHFGGTAEYLQPFLRARGDAGLPTILTFNTDINLSESMESYLTTWTWAEFTGPDLRR